MLTNLGPWTSTLVFALAMQSTIAVQMSSGGTIKGLVSHEGHFSEVQGEAEMNENLSLKSEAGELIESVLEGDLDNDDEDSEQGKTDIASGNPTALKSPQHIATNLCNDYHCGGLLYPRRRRNLPTKLPTFSTLKTCTGGGKFSSEQTILLDTSRRRTQACFHPSIKTNGHLMVYPPYFPLENKFWLCRCLSYFLVEGDNEDDVKELMCHCPGVCRDFKETLGCPVSTYQHQIDAELMQNAPADPSQAGGRSGLAERSNGSEEDWASSTARSLDASVEGKCV